MTTATRSPKRARREPTAEQRQAAAERRERMRKLAATVAAMSDEERREIAGHVITIEGHPLSLHNACMLAMQLPGVSVVGGYRQWRKAGRHVVKGARGLSIWVPIAAPKADEDSERDERPRFRLANVFDIAQTAEIQEEAA